MCCFRVLLTTKMIYAIVWHLLAVSAYSETTETAAPYTICAYHAGTIGTVNVEERKSISADGTTIKCHDTYCYTVWEERQDNETVVMSQGCWKQSGRPNDCEGSACESDKPPPQQNATKYTKFCCCAKDSCNANFTDVFVPSHAAEDTKGAAEAPVKVSGGNSLVFWAISGAILLFVALAGAGVTFYFRYYFWKVDVKKGDPEMGLPMAPPSDYSLEKLKLLNMIGQGKYGAVWRGVIDDQELAVKIFPSYYKNCFFTEYEMYQAAGEHPCLLRCFGGGEYAKQQPGQYALLLSLERHSVQEHLKNHTLDLATLSRMCLDIAKGLAHLHNDVGKKCVVHRDLNTKNILVRSDLSCCICDLGLAFVPRRAENKALSEAGTLRYMSPEVLEGAVNLRDCESALKQTDVYALGLVLWELGSRCSDMQNAEPQPYCPPFFKEVGENPTLEQMQTLVSRRKVRPLWPVSWKDTAAARLLAETASDCWDQDAEARLTAICVVERFLDLPNMKGRVLHPLHPPASPTPLINNNHLHDNPPDSSAETVETLLSPSNEEYCKNSNQLVSCVPPLQPHQGRNPCLERNLLSGSSDSLLIDKSSKHCTSSESQNLLANEFLAYQLNARANPIPYVQNPVYGMPKQQNVAVQSAHPNAAQPPTAHNVRRENGTGRRFKWSNLKRFLHAANKPWQSRNGLKETQVRLKSKIVNRPGGVTTALLGESEAKRPCTLGLSVARPQEFTNNSGVTQILKGRNSLSRQRSLEQFTEIFSSTTDLSRLKDPAQRVKTPGDVPPSVRKTRGKAATDSTARFSLYDDRMMTAVGGRGSWGSAPDLEPPVSSTGRTPPPPPPGGSDSSASVSSF